MVDLASLKVKLGLSPEFSDASVEFHQAYRTMHNVGGKNFHLPTLKVVGINSLTAIGFSQEYSDKIVSYILEGDFL